LPRKSGSRNHSHAEEDPYGNKWRVVVTTDSAEEQPWVLNQTWKGFAAIPFFDLGSCRHCVVKHRIEVPVDIWEGAMLYE
jgi:hypothetical protein